jgi:chromosome partitioning protein
MRRIAIINQKGGVGKTTTTANLGVALARLGQRVLVIDIDPQSHLTLHLGQEPNPDRLNVYHLLTQHKSVGDCLDRISEHLDLIGSHIDLAAAEIELVGVVGREQILRDALEGCEDQYDYLLIDCPPSLGLLTLNALCAAHEVFIPLQPHFLALQGLSKLLETIQLVQSRINPNLTVSGVVLCMYDAGTRLAGEVIDDLRGFFSESRDQEVPWSDARIFETVIRRNIRLAESPSHGRSIFDYAPSSNGSKDYAALCREVCGFSRHIGPLPSSAADEENASAVHSGGDPGE